MEKGRGPHAISFALICACVLLAWCPDTFALNPKLDVSQYAHTSWKIRDGFPKGEITSIVQTPDGYLWLGTESGLFRFDGVRNVLWRPPGNQELPSNFIFSLLVSRDGTLWIGTAKGLASWKDGKLTQYPELAGHYLFKIIEDHDGTVWASGLTVPLGRLCAIRNGNVQCFGEDGSLGRGAFNLYEDRKGNLWAGVKDGLWRWKPGPPKFYPLAGEPDGIQCFGEDTDGTLLVGWKGAIHRFIDGKTEPYSIPGRTGQIRGRRMLRDREGSLWIGTFNEGLVHVHEGKTDVFGLSEGLSGETAGVLFEDREGNIWVGSGNGLDRFRDFAIATLSVNEGLSSPRIRSVLADRDGGVWLATPDSLNRWNNGQVTILNGKTNGFAPNSLFQDDAGRIWVSTPFGFGYLKDDRFVSVSEVPGAVAAMAQDAAGNLWISNEHAGLFQVVRESVVQQIPWSKFGHEDPVTAVIPDQLHGGLWLGFFLGGLAYYNGGQVQASYTAADGLTGGRVSGLRLDQDGSLWIATESGLSRLKNGRIATLTSRNGLPCDGVHWLREDDAHSFWFYTPCGLLRVARNELNAWAAEIDRDRNAQPLVHATVFDTLDGVRSLATASHFFPQVAKSTDGRLWFAIVEGGINVVDPNHLSFNNAPPPVHIEQFVADRKTYEATSEGSGPVRLPALIRDLQIDFTALSLVVPEKILFRYKLEPRDRDWQDAGNRRQAFYNDLGPGTYRFRVMACNNSGVWNETGTYVDFTIAPAYYQSAWFRVSVVVLFLLVLGALYQLRLRQVARVVRGRMEERLEERERIARDLHDTLLQSVQGLILKFHAVLKQIPADLPAHDALEKTLDHADEVLAEGRDRIRNLRVRSASLSDLPAAFRAVAEETSEGREAVFKTVVEGHVRELHPLVLEECYCIGREAIINALAHSEGQHVEAEITYDSRQFRLRVRDDGRGIDPTILEAGGRSGHWGLQGMHERAQKIGGQLRFWSRPETGTEVELIVRGATAYQGVSQKPANIRFR